MPLWSQLMEESTGALAYCLEMMRKIKGVVGVLCVSLKFYVLVGESLGHGGIAQG